MKSLIDFSQHPSMDFEYLPRLEYPAVIFEGEQRDSDGEVAYFYTVAGMIGGQNVHKNLVENGNVRTYGALIGGDCIVVHAKNRGEADAIAVDGLWHTMSRVADAQNVAQKQNEGIIVETYRGRQNRGH